MAESSVKENQIVFPLTTKQQEFFRMGRQAIQRLQDQMNGVLQYICMENNIQGKNITLSDDASEIVVDQ